MRGSTITYIVVGWLAVSLALTLLLGWLGRGHHQAPMPSRAVDDDDLEAKAS